MKHEIIKTDNYLLVVDESEITKSDWIYCPKEEAVTEENRIYQIELFDETRSSHVIKGTDGIWYSRSYGAKIIAHLPLNGSPILKGVNLLPALEDDAICPYPESKQNAVDWHNGYNKAKEKYKYTEEDMITFGIRVTSEAFSIVDGKGYIDMQKFDKILQSLSQPEMPIGFDLQIGVCERWLSEEDCTDNCCGIPEKKITTTTPEGHTQWVGTYIYE